MAGTWPELSYPGWRETAITLQLWTQVVGKVRLALTPWVNHSWHVPLYVTARGLGTSPMPVGDDALEIAFDFLDHRLLATSSWGDTESLALAPQSVAAFHRGLMTLLGRMGVEVSINERPNEVPDPIPFPEDETHVSYDPDAVNRFFRALTQADRVFKHFRSGFLGKVSPVHFFWGSFDLAVTRFSGRPAPRHPGGVPHLPNAVAREAYSHEVSSAGFWPGSDLFPKPAFYSYAYPEPRGFRAHSVTTEASYETTLGEFILPYDAVRAARDPDALLLDFLETTYTAAADCADWNRAALECPLGAPGIVRPLPLPDATPP